MKRKEILATEHCPMDNNDKWLFEYNPDWHGLRVMQRTCIKCGISVILYQLNEESKVAELDQIYKELNNPKQV